MTSADWRVTLANNVVVMMSPRVDVSRRKPSMCKRMEARDSAWWSLEAHDDAWVLAQNLLAAREGTWQIRWWLGFHNRVDRRRKILVVPAKTQSEQGSQRWRFGSGLETLNGSGYRSGTRDNDWNASEVYRRMAAAAVVMAEAIVNLK